MAAVFCINTAKQATTEISPFELVYGRTAVLPREAAFPWPPDEPELSDEFQKRVARWRRVAAVARQLILTTQRKSKAAYDKYHGPDPVFRPGELVLVARRRQTKGRTKKFLQKFVGPYQVVRRVSSTCYFVEDLPSHRRRRFWRRFNVHSSQLRRYVARRETDWLPEENETDDDVMAMDDTGAGVVTREGTRVQNGLTGEDIEDGIIDNPIVPAPTPVIVTRSGRVYRPPIRF